MEFEPLIKETQSGLREEGTTHRQTQAGTASNLADGKSACFVQSFWLMTAEPIKEEGTGEGAANAAKEISDDFHLSPLATRKQCEEEGE